MVIVYYLYMKVYEEYNSKIDSKRYFFFMRYDSIHINFPIIVYGHGRGIR